MTNVPVGTTTTGATAHSEVGVLPADGLGAPAPADLAARHRVPIHELTLRGASLVDVYLRLTEDSVGPVPRRPSDDRCAGRH